VIHRVEGKVTAGSLNVNGASAVRRTLSLTFTITDEDNKDFLSLNSQLSLNKKIQVFIG
jgi:hypothetical protein